MHPAAQRCKLYDEKKNLEGRRGKNIVHRTSHTVPQSSIRAFVIYQQKEAQMLPQLSEEKNASNCKQLF